MRQSQLQSRAKETSWPCDFHAGILLQNRAKTLASHALEDQIRDQTLITWYPSDCWKAAFVFFSSIQEDIPGRRQSTRKLFPPKMTAFTFNDASAVGPNNVRLKCQMHKLQKLLKKSFLNKRLKVPRRRKPTQTEQDTNIK
ncbi:hypothetical protein Anapl_13291 [Anas platyrhynchos]|uniref:Uncharacterized protein n=1 Tax=Anas platyrhynchos TaxID=8839 RepID=R0LQ55_ANAPL|nr:hypothetical protein Anapl_13291 [Anas platyrhynchos]